jgi:hypothetical protein
MASLHASDHFLGAGFHLFALLGIGDLSLG